MKPFWINVCCEMWVQWEFLTPPLCHSCAGNFRWSFQNLLEESPFFRRHSASWSCHFVGSTVSTVCVKHVQLSTVCAIDLIKCLCQQVGCLHPIYLIECYCISYRVKYFWWIGIFDIYLHTSECTWITCSITVCFLLIISRLGQNWRQRENHQHSRFTP